MEAALDNPIWTALHGRQAAWGECRELACRYLPDVTSRGALAAATPEAFADLAALQQPGETTDVTFTGSFAAPAGWSQVRVLPLLQYVLDAAAAAPAVEGLVELGAEDNGDMIALARETRPGPFGRRTRELGTYLGVRRAGQLLAMAGERIQVPGHTEISAVCTRPEAQGKGLAAALVASLAQRIQARGEGVFLHVLAENTRAIALYERLGFRLRQRMQVVVLRRPPSDFSLRPRLEPARGDAHAG